MIRFGAGLLLIAAGLYLLVHAALIGAAMVLAGAALIRSAGRAGEDAFMGVLMVLAAIGAAAQALRWAWERFTAGP